MLNLAGLTRVEYVFYYPDTKDIVIAGPAEGYVRDATGRMVGTTTRRATLQLEDLIVALRAFAPDSRPTDMIRVFDRSDARRLGKFAKDAQSGHSPDA